MLDAAKKREESKKTYFITTYGCQMNEHDSERLAGLLEAEGYARASKPADASVVLFNTCCIRENADNKLYGNLGHMKAIKDVRPDMKLVVGGCLAQKDKSAIQKRAPWVDVVLGTHNLASLPRLLEESNASPAFEILEQTEVFPSALPSRRNSPWHAWVSISIGCNNSCTFCIVPAVRGREVSRRLGDIVSEVEQLVDDGVVEVTLLGQNVNSYGRDLDGTPMFAKLLRALDRVDGLERVRFTSPHPKDFRADTIAAMADCGVVCEHIHLPVQAGSDLVLKRMKRAYTRSKYLEKVALVRKAIPDVSISTDIIVGFPGETESEFAETMTLMEEARYDSAYTFQYSVSSDDRGRGHGRPPSQGDRAGAVRTADSASGRHLSRAQRAPRGHHAGGDRRGSLQEGFEQAQRPDAAQQTRPLPD